MTDNKGFFGNITNVIFKAVGLLLIGLLILSFAVWGVGDVLRGGVSDSVASVGSQDISAREVDRYAANITPAIRVQFGESIPAEVIKDQALQGLIIQSMLDQEAHSLGLGAGRNMAEQKIKDQVIFKNLQGKFDPDRLRIYLQNTRMTEQDLIAQTISDIDRGLMTRAIGMRLPSLEAEVKLISEHIGRVYEVEIFALPADFDMDVDAATPEEEELQAVYEANKARFTVDEMRDIRYFEMSADKIAANLRVNDGDLRELYIAREGDDAGFAELSEEELQELAGRFWDERSSDILYNRARNVDDILAGGGSFDEAAKVAQAMQSALDGVSRSGDVKSGSEDAAQIFSRYPDLLKAAFAAQEGRAGALIASRDGEGYIAFEVEKIAPQRVKDIAEVHDQVIKIWSAEQRDEARRQHTVKLRDGLSRKLGADIAAFAKSGGLVYSAGAFSRMQPAGEALMPRPLEEALRGMHMDMSAQDRLSGVYEREDGAFVFAYLRSVKERVIDDQAVSEIPISDLLSSSRAAEVQQYHMEYLYRKYPVSR